MAAASQGAMTPNRGYSSTPPSTIIGRSNFFYKLIVAFIITSTIIIPDFVYAEKSKEYKMIHVCKNHFLQQLYRKIDGAVLTSQNERNLDCAITFQTHSILQRFMLRFDRLQLDCNDHLYIYDGAHAVGNYKADITCRNTKQSVGAIFTRTNFVTLKYVTDGWGTESNGFRLVITAVKDPKHTCKDFKCNAREFCIDTDLVCDGVNHCGDGSDESTSTLCANTEASTILGMERTWFAVAIVSTLITLAGVVAGMVMCFCKQRTSTPRHLHNANNAQNHPTVGFPLQQMYGSNGANVGTIIGSGPIQSTTMLKGQNLQNQQYPLQQQQQQQQQHHHHQGAILGATTLPRPGNWLRPAGLRLGHSEVRVRLYCQAK